MQLRPYQKEAIAATWRWFRENPSGAPLIVLPTGAGKSVVIAELAKKVAERGADRRVLILAHRKELISQNHDKLCTLWPFGSIGIYSAGLKKREGDSQVVFAGIQSVYKRAEELGCFSLVIIDEAHLIPSSGDGMYRTLIDGLREKNPAVRFLGCTGTPYRLGSGMLTEGKDPLFTEVAFDANIKDLIDSGYLSPLVSKSCANRPDVSKIAVRGGEYIAEQMEQAFNRLDLVQAALAEAVSLGADRKSWLIFASGVAHAERIAEVLSRVGIRAGVVTGDTPPLIREQILAEFKAGDLKAVVNCEVLCLDAETEILTTDGWVGIDDMTMQHEVANYDLGGKVFFERPKRVVRRDRMPHEIMVSIDQKGVNARVTSNHRMLFKTAPCQTYAIQAAEQIVGRSGIVPISGYADPMSVAPEQPAIVGPTSRRVIANSYTLRKRGMSPENARNEAIRRIEEHSAKLRYKSPADLSLDECRFIGFWIGDGTRVNKHGGGVECSVTQSWEYPAMIAWFDDLIARIGLRVDRDERKKFIRWNFSRGTGFGPQAMKGGYFSIEPYLTKKKNRLLWGLNQEQFDALIEGLWRADGSHGDGRIIPRAMRIVGPDIELFSFLQGIACTKGYRASITRITPRKSHHSVLYWLSITKNRPFAHITKPLTFQLESGFKDERVWCVTSTTGNIITRRRGRVLITGNTTGFDHPGIDLIVVLRATKSTGLWVQMVGRGARKAAGKENCLVLDFGGNILQHGPLDKISISYRRSPLTGRQEGRLNTPPMKECFVCRSVVPISMRECPDCSTPFPEPARINHGAEASDAPILSGQPEPVKEVDVLSVKFKKWKKEEKPHPTLRVDYVLSALADVPINTVPEWVCLEHPSGFARDKAVAWWLDRVRHHEDPIPTSIDEALSRLDELRTPKKIQIQRDGKYWRVIKVLEFYPDGEGGGGSSSSDPDLEFMLETGFNI